MIYLKYFESNEVSLEEKLNSIVDMYNYLCDNGMQDSFGYIGNCSVLFLRHQKSNREYTYKKIYKKDDEMRPYIFYIEPLINDITNNNITRRDEKMKLIEDLYSISKIQRFNKTKEDILDMFKGIESIESSGIKIVKDIEILQYYNEFYRKPSFKLRFVFDDDLLSFNDNEIKAIAISKFSSNNYDSDLSDMIYKEYKIIENKLSSFIGKLNLKSKGIDSYTISNDTNFNSYYSLSIYLQLK